MKINGVHIPVMKQQVLDALRVREGGFYIDATYGAGGHSLAILQRSAAVLAFDKDHAAIERAELLKEQFSDRFVIKHTSFVDIERAWAENGAPMLADGIIIDLGFSSDQIDDSERGFSFNKNGPLDMRYDVMQELHAQRWVNTSSKDEMFHVFTTYGEERNAWAISKAIAKARLLKPIMTTFDLVNIIATVNKHDHKHIATRVFQAIRIHVNDEFASIKRVLIGAKNVLKKNGRLAVLTFHSLEDKIVKDFFENEINFILLPSEEEILQNRRSRSAKLRWMVKIDGEC